MSKTLSTTMAVGLFIVAAIMAALSAPAMAQDPAPAPQTPGAVQLPAPAVDTGNLVALPSVAPVAHKAKPAVVNIFTVKFVKSGQRNSNRRGFRGTPEEFFEDFFGFQVPPRSNKQSALGSGFIFDPQGFIITNNHVVEDADDIKVKLADGRELTAEIIGRDPKTDLALIKLTTPGPYPYISLGDSDRIEIGDWLVAIGNPFGLEHTVTAGILSARGRTIGVGPYDDFLQTDASINPGNSGGPLLNLRGEVVGINTIIIAGGSGIGFAIPSNVATKIIDQLKANGRVERGWIGVLIQELTPDMAKSFGLDDNTQGSLIGNVVEGSPAETGGLKHGDIIVEFDGKPIKAWQELTSIVADTPIGKVVNVVVVRDKKKVTLKLTVGKLEDDGSSLGGLSSPGFDLGLTLQELTPELAARHDLGGRSGLLVQGVGNDSLAAEAGIQPQDIILEVDRQPVPTLAEYQRIVRQHAKGTPILLWIKRGNQTIFFSLGLND
ncbi:MAG: Do family serine endopeptidase [Deltaproteobacteria bacterium]|jgi:serine protease Do|nr:Do family serine endopeptidase [Deltaproteobacteria bacterium]